ncbi:MAG TPA: molybdopterin-dependent oxidoreductase [Puia sp.]|nr:molybdopterin-dependent oxidoreductase [Puia sp.]
MKKFIKNIFVNNSKLSVDELISKKTFISFFFFFLFIAIGIGAWKWLWNQPLDNNMSGAIQKPLRAVLNFNEKIFDKTLSPNHLAKAYPTAEAARRVRVNGNVGMGNDFDAAAWKLQVIKNNGDTLFFTLDDIKRLPKTEIIFNFKCIEGWNQITWWGGARFSDFVKYYHLENESNMKYVGLSTPDEQYYVGIDMPSAIHPQTLLCYEMNRQPLPMNQGYPLRLIIPVKYGIKSIKRIGTIFFSDERPRDYWFERGYDYYSGL